MLKSLFILGLFTAFFYTVGYFISRKGWYPLLKDTFSPDPEGEKIPKISGVISGVSYGMTIDIWINESGCWIRPRHIFRACHPCGFLSFDFLLKKQEKRKMLQEVTELYFSKNGINAVLSIPLNKTIVEILQKVPK